MDGRESFKALLAATQQIADAIPKITAPSTPGVKQEVIKSDSPSKEPKPIDEPLKVLVSWAHRGEYWSSQQEKDWEQLVMEFTTALRSMGIDADIDLFHTHEDGADWTRFGQNAVRDADYVLVAITKGWAQRWSGTNSPHVGAGAAVEADTLKGLFIKNQTELQKKLKLVVLGDQSPRCIPEDMARFTYFKIDVDNLDSFEDLLRTLTSQPYYEKPDLGEVPILPPAIRQSFKKKAARTATHDDLADYDAVREEIATLEMSQHRRKIPSVEVQQRLEVLRAVLNAMSN
ncbi:hypothetical protein NIBR502772_22005 [Pseudarthrobacter sp. NIBRBAC000502772]|uniref:hypothetical protein n=1 Tax=Pseudarthrobacter sp. NIBRBAC000502772 TaxID=2590775 RepID=UPI001131B19D|nr:hypothetical protein [Pseudarthrobacter sp. NIBRBAC000502772]QDG68524.1 hypothetical protein NIBR502772_22005 [Pseudarthrobacter sp. NIBRBAC000502772]